MNDIQIKGSEDYGKLCCFIDDEGNEFYGHLSLFMEAISNNPNERNMYFCEENGKAYRMAWKVDEEDVALFPDEEVIHEQNKTIERLQEQLKEANEAIKLYAETFVGNKNEDGTFTIYVFGSFPTNKNVYGYQELRYDPRPAKKYLEKWGVK